MRPSNLHLVSAASLHDSVATQQRLPHGKLIEISGSRFAARMSTAAAVVRETQAEGDPAAWIQPLGGPLYPPDLDEAGIDLDALAVVHIPPPADDHHFAKAADLLLRSGAFGAIVIDLSSSKPRCDIAWQRRLLGLAREHQSRVLLLTHKPTHASSLGSLIGLRIEPHRARLRQDVFCIEHHVLKNKSGWLENPPEHRRGPWGLR